MIKKIKLALTALPLLCVLFHSNIALAEESPHIVPALGCPAGETCCPSELYCSYGEACGDTDHWDYGTQVPAFEGVKQFILSKISATFLSVEHKTYGFVCEYKSQDESSISLSLIDDPHRYTITGNWEYSGFGNRIATCGSNNPLDCTGTKVY